ncbi:MAG: methylmalonyl-CoA mutase family protein [Acidobacteriota bacterium]|nr:methylmalonyl-CoA mutase family protein [Acidobacteriota bacterium]
MGRTPTGQTRLNKSKRRWVEETLAPSWKRFPPRLPEFTSISGHPIQPLYGPDDLEDFDPEQELGFPGEPPYTRGIHPSMYRGRLWTMRQFSGFGTAQDTNRRFLYLLRQGQTGLSVAFDLPTLMGLDSDHPTASGEIGKCGVAVDTLADMEVLFRDIDLETISTSMTINCPAAVIWAMFLAHAEKSGFSWAKLRGTLQNDILKEYIAQKEWIYPPHPSMRLVTDTIAFATRSVPQWNSVSISGYHIREAGSTALQELAFTLRDGIEYVEAAVRAGLEVDDFAPRLSFFFNAHNDFFEEIAKYRAARKVWCRVMKERFGCRDPRSSMLRFHAQTAGCSLTAQQPHNNIVRTAIQALAAILGGTQSLHTNSMDETYALPTEQAATIALRSQQILATESEVANTVDPMAGSYFVEKLTLELEKGCWDYFEKIDAMGGMVAAIERCYPQKEILDAAYRYQQAVERGEKVIVGVNRFAVDEEQPIDTLAIESGVADKQLDSLHRVKASRDERAVRRSLAELRRAAATDENLMPFLLSCVKAYATLGEVCEEMKQVFGTYEEPVF